MDDENSIEFEFQTDCSNYFDLRQTYFSLVLKVVKHREFDSYKKEVKKEHNKIEDENTDADDDIYMRRIRYICRKSGVYYQVKGAFSVKRERTVF